MKQSELKKCTFCKEGVANGGQLMCTRVVVTRLVVNAPAVQRQHGLEMFFGGGNGGAALAAVMGADEDLLKELGPPADLLVCDRCALKHCVLELIEERP